MKRAAGILYVICCTILSSTSLKAQRHNAILRIKACPAIPYIVVQRFGQYGINFSMDTIFLTQGRGVARRLTMQEPEVLGFTYGDKKFIRLWLKPGDDLTIDLQGENPVFKGEAAVFAKYFINDQIFWSKTNNDYKIKNPGFDIADNLFSNTYFLIQDSITIQRINFLEDYFNKITVAQRREFVQYQKQDLIYANLYYKLAFEGTDIKKFKCCQDKYNIKHPDYYAFSDVPVFNDPQLLTNLYYRKFVSSLIMGIARRRLKDNVVKWNFNAYADSAMHAADELAAGSDMAIELKAIFLNDLVDEIGRERKPAYIAKTNEILRTLDDKPGIRLGLVKEKFRKIVLDTRFNTGDQAPDFTLQDTLGKIYTLKDFRGKKIYLDITASWCSPCIDLIPVWNNLVEKDSNDQQVVFISLSLDEDEKGWKTLLKKHPIKGMLLFAGKGGFKSNFALDYNITGIPHFILLDREGKISQYTAPRPGDGEIENILVQ